MGIFVSPEELRVWADLDNSDPNLTTGVLVPLIAAVEAAVTGSHSIPNPTDDPPAEVPADAKQGILMQCARLYRRRFTPEGVATFGGDFALRVNRFDPDVDLLLDRYKVWSVG